MGQKPLFTPGDPEVESEGTKTPSKAFSDCSLLRPPSYYWSEFGGPPLMSLSLLTLELTRSCEHHC